MCEAWSHELDPFWDQAKHEVRESFTYEDLPKEYIALQVILEKLENDHQALTEIYEKMARVIEEAEQVSSNNEPAIRQRISVVLFSDGTGEFVVASDSGEARSWRHCRCAQNATLQPLISLKEIWGIHP